MEAFLSNAGNVMAVGVAVLLGAALFKLWQQSKEDPSKGGPKK